MFSKNKPHEIVYRNYKYFNSQNLNDELKVKSIDSCSKFNQMFLDVLNKHAPEKRSALKLIMLHMCLSPCKKL